MVTSTLIPALKHTNSCDNSSPTSNTSSSIAVATSRGANATRMPVSSSWSGPGWFQNRPLHARRVEKSGQFVFRTHRADVNAASALPHSRHEADAVVERGEVGGGVGIKAVGDR